MAKLGQQQSLRQTDITVIGAVSDNVDLSFLRNYVQKSY